MASPCRRPHRSPKPRSSYETGSDGAPSRPPGPRRVPTGPQRARGATVGALGGPYLSRAPIRDSRVIRQTLTGPVVPNRGSDGTPTEPRLEPIWPDGPRRALTEDSMDPYRCTTKIRTHTGPRRPLTSPDGTRWTRIGVRLRYGPIWVPDEPRRDLTGPNGTQPDVNK